MANIFQMLGASFVVVMGLMFILWVVYFLRRNAGIIDIGWAVGFMLAAWIYAFMGDGYAPKKWLIAIMVSIWGARLAQHLYDRFLVSPEDPRYVSLREKWGGDKDGSLFLMLFLFQGFLVMVLSIPFLIITHAAEPIWSGWELVGFFIWAIGVIGESVADYQLKKFRENPANAGKVYESGLWYFSRHPNYFFEWLVWVGYFIIALPTPGGWISVISPIIMLTLLMKVSGVPLSEAQALKTKGEAYRQYQKKTSVFFPWFRSSSADSNGGS